NVGWNHGRDAGQHVLYLDVHGVPRYQPRGGGGSSPRGGGGRGQLRRRWGADWQGSREGARFWWRRPWPSISLARPTNLTGGKMKAYWMLAAFFSFASTAGAAVKSKVVDYNDGATPLQGFLAWDEAAKEKRPGILVVHEWWGHNQHARNQALRLAKAGYVAFALD